MVFVGIDVAKDKHDLYAVDSDGVVLCNNFTFANSAAGFASFLKQVSPCIKDKHTPRSHRGNKGHISGQKGYWFFEAFMEQKQCDESPRETLAISQKNVHQIRCSMNIRQ